MSKHEIEIEGLDPEWEPVRFGVIRAGDSYLGEDGKIWTRDSTSVQEFGLIVRRKVRKYDWSKTLDDVLVGGPKVFVRNQDSNASFSKEIAKIWQPNIHGKCPVDGEACIVRVRFADDTCHEGIAAKFTWVLDGEFDDIIAYQFIRLADGVEW